MISHAWVEKQIFSLPLGELKRRLGVKRLTYDRKQIVAMLDCWLEHQTTQQHLRGIHASHREAVGVGYSGFMKRLARVARLSGWLFHSHRKQAGIGVVGVEYHLDSTLLPTKREANIRQKDWDAGCVTIRRGSNGRKTFICGEKALVATDGDSLIVHQSLMPSINDSDMNVLKQPLVLAQMGVRQGVLMVDRGFSCNAVRERLDNFQLLGKLTLISPWHKRSKTQMTEWEWAVYRARWKIEEVFRQLKDFHQPYRLNLTGLRKRIFHHARLAMACLAWNWEKRPILT